MSNATFIGSVELITEVCYKCAMLFAFPREHQRRLLNDHSQQFFCPAGHPQVYTGRSEVDKLRDEVTRRQQMLEAEQARTRRVAHERDQVAKAHSRMRHRVMNGVCPCCNRTFQNLMAHMKTEHAGEVNLATLRQAFGMTQAAVAEEIGVTNLHVSQYERGKPVAGYAKVRIEGWVNRQAKVKS